MIRFAVVFLAVSLAACSANYYKPPGKEDPHSTIDGSSFRSGGVLSSDWESYFCIEIDGQPIRPFGFTSYQRITPGVHTVTVRGAFNRPSNTWKVSPCPCEAHAELEFVAKPDRNYIVTGKVAGKVVHRNSEEGNAVVRMWVQDTDSGEIVSEVVVTDYEKVPDDILIII